MSDCAGCGTELKNCGAPIWEDYCPNKECHYEAEQFKARMRKAGEEMRRKKALEAAAPDLYEALEALMKEYSKVLREYKGVDVGSCGDVAYDVAGVALTKARGETL